MMVEDWEQGSIDSNIISIGAARKLCQGSRATRVFMMQACPPHVAEMCCFPPDMYKQPAPNPEPSA